MTALQPRGRGSSVGSQTARGGPQEEVEEELIYMQCCGQEDPVRENQNQNQNQHQNQHQPQHQPQSQPQNQHQPQHQSQHQSQTQPQSQPQGPACRQVYPATAASAGPRQVYPATAASAGVWPSSSALTCAGSSNSFRSPESVEMDEIMAAMVLTSLSCSPMMHSGAPQKDLLPACSSSGDIPACSSSGDMECGGGELSDSGSSGYWSWDHGSVSPAPSPSVAEMDGSLGQSDEGLHMGQSDEGLHMELDMGDGRRHKGSGRGAYRCLWPGCSKVMNSRVVMKRHIHLHHLGGESEHSQREEDFYYTEVSSEEEPSPPSPSTATSPSQSPSQSPSLVPTSSTSSSSTGAWPPSTSTSSTSSTSSSSSGAWTSSSSSGVWPSCSSSSSGASPPGPQASSSAYSSSSTTPLSQSAPSSVWQIHTEHLYQACAPVQVTVSSGSASPPSYWAPSGDAQGHSLHTHTQVLSSRSRSVSVGEQWLQRNTTAPTRSHAISASPSRNHCTFRKGRGEAKKCRKVYGVERRDQWCTACRWKKACQRFPD